jgi:hypothetical protein
MKVICADLTGEMYTGKIKIGKTYNVVHTETYLFNNLKQVILTIICDDGHVRRFREKHFLTLEEFRSKQLDKLDI